jgi:hypothetical protein
MISPTQLFSTDPGKFTDFSGVPAATVFNDSILPRLSSLASLLGSDPAGLDEASQRRDAQARSDDEQFAYNAQQDDQFLANLQNKPQSPSIEDMNAVEDYNVPIAPITSAPASNTTPIPRSKGGFKLSNYGYDSDSSPDYNSNTLKIGHANNPLKDGVSAALTKSLAKRYGLKTGDYFEAETSDGKILKRRYDDTVPTKYKGKPLPETVDLYEVNGSNKFGGIVVGIKPLKSQ